MLAAVLWLGNISFLVIDNENHIEVVADEGSYMFSVGLCYFCLQLLYLLYIELETYNKRIFCFQQYKFRPNELMQLSSAMIVLA